MGDLSTYTVQDLVVMAESAGSHPECQQVPLAAIVREIERRIEEMDRAVGVLAAGVASVPELMTEEMMANPIARAAIEKARKGT